MILSSSQTTLIDLNILNDKEGFFTKKLELSAITLQFLENLNFYLINIKTYKLIVIELC